jgi:hypothetical protein
MTDVFISYSRKDKALVQRLDEALKKKKRKAWVGALDSCAVQPGRRTHAGSM